MIAIASDHAGFPLKEKLVDFLREKGLAYCDYGCESEASVDYPQFAAKVAKAVKSGQAQHGILICGTGLGVSYMANRFDGIRAALCTNEFMARMARAHNDANILVMGAFVVAPPLAISILDTFLNTSFDGGRHERRIAMLDDPSMRE